MQIVVEGWNRQKSNSWWDKIGFNPKLNLKFQNYTNFNKLIIIVPCEYENGSRRSLNLEI